MRESTTLLFFLHFSSYRKKPSQFCFFPWSLACTSWTCISRRELCVFLFLVSVMRSVFDDTYLKEHTHTALLLNYLSRLYAIVWFIYISLSNEWTFSWIVRKRAWYIINMCMCGYVCVHIHMYVYKQNNVYVAFSWWRHLDLSKILFLQWQ